MTLPIDLGWLVTATGQRKLASWWPDDDNTYGVLILDGPGGPEDLGVYDLPTARLLCDGVATADQLRDRIETLP